MNKLTILLKKYFMKNINWTLILSILGVLAWLPYVFDKLTPVKIEGKLISLYGNIGTYKGTPSTILLMKLGIISENKDFNIKDVDIQINFKNSGWIKTTSYNTREALFTYNNTTKKLNLRNEDFINNMVSLPKDQAIAGYLITSTPVHINEEILQIELIFIPFSGKTKKVLLDKSKISEDKFLFDDKIWTDIDLNSK